MSLLAEMKNVVSAGCHWTEMASDAALDLIIDEDWEWRMKDLPEFATGASAINTFFQHV